MIVGKLKTKILNFVEAGNLYELLSKYKVKDLDSLSPFQFVERFIEVVIPEDYLEFLRLLFGQDIQEVKLEKVVDTVSKNNINSLVKAFENLNGKSKP